MTSTALALVFILGAASSGAAYGTSRDSRDIVSGAKSPLKMAKDFFCPAFSCLGDPQWALPFNGTMEGASASLEQAGAANAAAEEVKKDGTGSAGESISRTGGVVAVTSGDPACRADIPNGKESPSSATGKKCGDKSKEKRYMDHELPPVSVSAHALRGAVEVQELRMPIIKEVDRLLEAHLAGSTKAQALDKAVKHFSSVRSKLAVVGKDALNYYIPFKGFGPSREAGKVILGKEVRLKDKATAEYQRQKYIDETHARIVSSMMQLAMGVGLKDRARASQVVSSGLTSLSDLVGRQEAEKTLTALMVWSRQLHVAESIFNQAPWDVSQRDCKLKSIIAAAYQRDPIVSEMTRRVEKFANKGKVSTVGSSVVETSLGLAAWLIPGPSSWGANVAQVAFIQATGGSEQVKLRKELFLDKRMGVRQDVIKQEAGLAMDNYRFAQLSHNPCLLAFSESVIDDLSGSDLIPKVFGQSVLPVVNSGTAISDRKVAVPY